MISLQTVVELILAFILYHIFSYFFPLDFGIEDAPDFVHQILYFLILILRISITVLKHLKVKFCLS
jgi:hypothetical protein